MSIEKRWNTLLAKNNFEQTQRIVCKFAKESVSLPPV